MLKLWVSFSIVFYLAKHVISSHLRAEFSTIIDLHREDCTLVQIATKDNIPDFDMHGWRATLLLSVQEPKHFTEMVNKMPCPDLIVHSKKLLEEGLLPMRTSNARYIYKVPLPTNGNKTAHKIGAHEDVAFHIKENPQNGETKIFLSCPYYDSGEPRKVHSDIKLLNYKRSRDSDWFMDFKDYDKPYRLCNPGKSFYADKEFVTSGLDEDDAPIFDVLAEKFQISNLRLVETEKSPNYFNQDGSIIPESVMGRAYFRQAELCPGYTRDVRKSKFTDMVTTKESFSTFLTRKPRFKSPRDNLLYTIEPTAWIAIASSVVLVTLALLVVNIWYRRDWLNVATMPLGILFMENHFAEFQMERRLDGGSIIRLTWVLATALFVMAFQATIKASLMVRDYEPAVSTPREMFDQDVPVYGAFLSNWVPLMVGSDEDDDGSYSRWWDNIQRHNASLPGYHLFMPKLKDIADGERAFILYLSFYDWPELLDTGDLSQQHPFPFWPLKQRFELFEGGYALTKHLSYTEEIFQLFARMRYFGIFTAIRAKVMRSLPRTIDYEIHDDYTEKITFDHLYHSTILWGCLLGLCCLVFLVEMHKRVTSVILTIAKWIKKAAFFVGKIIWVVAKRIVNAVIMFVKECFEDRNEENGRSY